MLKITFGRSNLSFGVVTVCANRACQLLMIANTAGWI